MHEKESLPASLVAQVRLGSRDLSADLSVFIGQLGFRLESIYPADDPRVASLSGHGTRLQLVRGDNAPGTLVLSGAGERPGHWPDVTPGGTQLYWEPVEEQVSVPAHEVSFQVRRLRDSDAWIVGRAGMHYRDLVPDRLGGSLIASHIRIPDGGPVPDMVHYHAVGFQLIYCYRGWVRLVYEDQGEPFILYAGDCVTQPPRIRHRVLEASDALEVVEIGVPAEHLTLIDHDMELPNATIDPQRCFDGQRFCHFQARQAHWRTWLTAEFEVADTGVGDATGGVAGVRVVRARPASRAGDAASAHGSHEADDTRVNSVAQVLFGFVLEGQLTLEDHSLESGDAFTLPAGLPVPFSAATSNCSWLEVTLPGVEWGQ